MPRVERRPLEWAQAASLDRLIGIDESAIKGGGGDWAYGRELESLRWKLLYPAPISIRGKAVALRPDRERPGCGQASVHPQYNVLTHRRGGGVAMGRDQVLQLRATAQQRQLIDQAAAAEGVSRTEFILRSCQERAQAVLLDRTLFSLTPEQSQALLTELSDPAQRQADQQVIAELLAAPAPWDAGA